MATQKRTTTAAPRKRAAPVARPKTETREGAVTKILRNVEKKMSGADVKATLGDYIRLVQLQKAIAEEPKTEIKVTWVEPREEPTGK